MNLSCEFREELRRKRLKKRREQRIFLGSQERGDRQGAWVAELDKPVSDHWRVLWAELCAPKFIWSGPNPQYLKM